MSTPSNRLEQMRAESKAYHEKYPEVWELFKQFTFDRINRGFSNYGVTAIFERIRWEAPAGADGHCHFKINNNFKPFYARRFAKTFPEHSGFFRFRHQISEDAEPSNLPPLGSDDFPYTNGN